MYSGSRTNGILLPQACCCLNYKWWFHHRWFHYKQWIYHHIAHQISWYTNRLYHFKQHEILSACSIPVYPVRLYGCVVYWLCRTQHQAYMRFEMEVLCIRRHTSLEIWDKWKMHLWVRCSFLVMKGSTYKLGFLRTSRYVCVPFLAQIRWPNNGTHSTLPLMTHRHKSQSGLSGVGQITFSVIHSKNCAHLLQLDHFNSPCPCGM